MVSRRGIRVQQTAKEKVVSSVDDQEKEKTGSKKNKSRQQANKEETKSCALVEELKLFQNNQQLLNQQDPMQRLHIQLSELVSEPEDATFRSPLNITTNLNASDSPSDLAPFKIKESVQHSASSLVHNGSQRFIHALNAIQQQALPSEDNLSTVKKGLLWQQQNYEKFHQRLFSRWKKRYFILTTDYLVCFKRTSSKVGRSEMGKFLYKTSLGDVTKIERLKPNKSDKGAIILHIRGAFNLSLWSKEDLQEWMLMLSECIERNKSRRSCVLTQNGSFMTSDKNINIKSNTGEQDSDLKKGVLLLEEQEDFYENTIHGSRLASAHMEKQCNSDGAEIEKLTEFNNNNINNMITPIKSSKESDGISKNELTSRLQTITKYSLNGSRRMNSVEGQLAEDSKAEEEEEKQLNACKSSPLRSSTQRRIAEVRERESESLRNELGKEKEEAFSLVSSPMKKVESPVVSKAARKSARRKKEERIAPSSEKDALEHGLNSDSRSSEESSTPDRRRQGNLELGERKTHKISSSTDCTPFVAVPNQEQPEGVINEPSSSASSNIQASNGRSNEAEANNASEKGWMLSEPEEEIVEELKINDQDQEEEGKEEETTPSRSMGNRLVKSQTRVIQCNDSCLNERLQQQQHSSNNNGNQLESRPQVSLIRRDDSWQSLVSLTRIGQSQRPANTSSAMQMAQRSLYAQHIMPESSEAAYAMRHRMLSIESTITPSRAPLMRQLSVQNPCLSGGAKGVPKSPALSGALTEQQVLSSGRKLFGAPSSGGIMGRSMNVDEARASNLQYSSFDSGHLTGTRKQQVPPAPSYTQQKLLQLQLLHNSNHVDYIRSGGGDYAGGSSIYGASGGPNSAIYGYSSMRSNLKSAASEFSFIRPSPSHHNQSALLAANSANGAKRADAALAQLLPGAPVDSSPAQVLSIEPEQVQAATRRAEMHSGLPCAPTRELPQLPLKPSKRRTPQQAEEDVSASGKQGGGTSSLGASIACFFRRAFSRRSKRRKRRAELAGRLTAESCSSSLGAFDPDAPGSVLLAPSAFSTGSKSVERAVRKEKYMEPPQGLLDARQLMQQPSIEFALHSPQVRAIQQPQQQQLGGASPLHKSNSISTTMSLTGLLGVETGPLLNGRSMLYDNAHLLAGSGSGQQQQQQRSPFLSRSNRLSGAFNSNAAAHQQRLLGRPAGELLPRPSSIYGQPSLTNSSANLRGLAALGPAAVLSPAHAVSPFGQHRNSLHNHQFRVSQQSGQMSVVGSGCQFPEMQQSQPQPRRTQLDTTRELAEEVSTWLSPSATASQASPALARKEIRRAVVSPMLQSPTMSAIYDNHPMLEHQQYPGSYSLYDNNQLVSSSSQQQFAGASSRGAHLHTPSRGNGSNKPAAMVAPTCANQSSTQQLITEHRSTTTRHSPLLARRNQQQQSPLIGRPSSHLIALNNQQPVVNIAGAPGINLEASLAASLLRGTAIDATYQSVSSIQRLQEHEAANSSGSRAFVVATRLSKSMIQSQVAAAAAAAAAAVKQASINQSYNNNKENSTASNSASSSIARSTHKRRSSLKDLDGSSTNGSRASSSSAALTPATNNRLKLSNYSNTSDAAGVDEQQNLRESLVEDGSSSGADSNSKLQRGSKSRHQSSRTKLAQANSRGKQRKRRDHSTSSSTTTTTNDDELNSTTSHQSSTNTSFDKPDERNWITSKLFN